MSLHGFVIPRSQGTAIWQKIDKKFKCRTFARTPLSAGLNIDTYMTLFFTAVHTFKPNDLPLNSAVDKGHVLFHF